jgi:hypothetical protein
MTSKAPPDGARSGSGFFQGLVQFFTSVTGMIAAFIGLLTAVVGLALAQQNASETSRESSPPGTSAPSSSSELRQSAEGTSAESSINQPIADTSSGSYVNLVEAQITPQLQDQLQAQVPDAVVTVDSVDCSPPDQGTCSADVSDSLGTTARLNIAYVVLDPTTGVFQWQVTG